MPTVLYTEGIEVWIYVDDPDKVIHCFDPNLNELTLSMDTLSIVARDDGITDDFVRRVARGVRHNLGHIINRWKEINPAD